MNEDLQEWKESAMSIMPDLQAIGKLLNIPVGESIHDKIIPGIARLKNIIEKIYKSNSPYTGGHLERNWHRFATDNNLQISDQGEHRMFSLEKELEQMREFARCQNKEPNEDILYGFELGYKRALGL